MASSMSNPFVYPVGRDFAPRFSDPQSGQSEALDVISLEKLRKLGIKRKVSIYTTHTVTTHEMIRSNAFFLWNPHVDIKINCSLERIPESDLPVEFNELHRPKDIPFNSLPEKLWHSFCRKGLWEKRLKKKHLKILILDFHLKVDKAEFSSLLKLFKGNRFNTLPLHLVHSWKYMDTKNTFTGDGDSSAWLWEQNETKTPIENVRKDFIIVERMENPSHVTVGVASDLHCAKRNSVISGAFSESENINDKITKFSTKAYQMWENGELDYLVLNGDLIDYYMQYNTHHSSDIYGHSGHHFPNYEDSNWRELELLAELSPKSTDRPRGLFNIPIIWNVGDHDRRVRVYPWAIIPIPKPLEMPFTEIEDITKNYHYNFYGLGLTETMEEMPEKIPDWTLMYPLGLFQRYYEDYDGNLRWIFEVSRLGGFPYTFHIKTGKRTFNFHVVDTGPTGNNKDHHWGSPFGYEFGNTPSGMQRDVQRPSGIDADLDFLNETSADEFTVIITHSPPICFEPDRLTDLEDEDSSTVSLAPSDSDAKYGTFINSRDVLLERLGNMIQESQPVLLVSGHVHLKSGYFLEKDSRGDLVSKTGPDFWAGIAELNEGEITAGAFWRDHNCVLLTTPSIGPKPMISGQSSEILLIKLEEDGISEIRWENLED